MLSQDQQTLSLFTGGGPFYQQLITILMATPHLWSGLTPIRGWPHHFTDEMQPVHHFQLPHPRWRQVGNYSTAKKRTSGGVSENGGTHKGMVYNGVLTSISGNPQMAGHLSWILWPRIHSSVESPNPSLFHPVFWCHWEGQAVVPSSDTPMDQGTTWDAYGYIWQPEPSLLKVLSPNGSQIEGGPWNLGPRCSHHLQNFRENLRPLPLGRWVLLITS